MIRNARIQSRREHGATAVTVALLLTVLAGFTAIGVNVGHMMVVRGQLQNATDAAALAAAVELNGTDTGLSVARAAAADYAERHQTDHATPVSIDQDADVTFGRWNAATRTFTEIPGTDPASLSRIDAVRVRAGREESRGNALQVFMSGILGRDTTNVRAQSVAVLGVPSGGGCGLAPFVIADCMCRNDAGELNCGGSFVFHSDGTDTIGWTNLTDDPSVNTDILRSILRSILTGEDCPDTVTEHESIAVSNGAQVNALYEDLVPLIGHTILVPVVGLPGEGSCSDKFNAHSSGAEVISFASLMITDVVGGKEKEIHFAMQCGEAAPPNTPGGGSVDMGTPATQARLVQ